MIGDTIMNTLQCAMHQCTFYLSREEELSLQAGYGGFVSVQSSGFPEKTLPSYFNQEI